ncbi:MAG TPA: pentapeptide repeat-containing protein [Kofleriaceae bacterium]|nr:pentapeptide repeat-containing protein [Kofleriaceae bacterium]
MSATKHFLGKFAMQWSSNQCYVGGDPTATDLVATYATITPNTTLLLYGTDPDLEVASVACQLQVNLQYLGQGSTYGGGTSPVPPLIVIAANQPELTGSGVFLFSLVSLNLPGGKSINYLAASGLPQQVSTVGILDYDGGSPAMWGYYLDPRDAPSGLNGVFTTPGIDAILEQGALVGGDLTFVDLTDESLVQVTLTSCRFDYAILAGTDFTGATIAGTSFIGCDLSQIIFDATTTLTSTQAAPMIFNEATLPAALLPAGDWSYMQLAGATVTGIVQPLSTQAAPLQAPGAVLVGMNGGDLTSFVLQDAVLTGAQLTSLDLSGADLTGANLGGALLQGVNLTNATLTGIVAPGAQLGGLSTLISLTTISPWQLFSADAAILAPAFQQVGIELSASASLTTVGASFTLDDTASGTEYTIVQSTSGAAGTTLTLYYVPQAGGPATAVVLPASALSLIDGNDVAGLVTVFEALSLPLSASAVLAVETASWQLVSGAQTWPIRLDSSSQSATVPTVYAAAAPANLSGAYLPDATLTDANLYGVSAPGCQLYGASATLAGAILEKADFSGANLGSMSLATAYLLGTTLDYAVLVNASFSGAQLTPAADGTATSLYAANLQGADFTDALVYGANLNNAAIAVNIGTQTDPIGGVWLFTLDTSLAATLQAATVSFSLNPNGDFATYEKMLNALDGANLHEVTEAFQREGGITLSSTAQITTQQQRGGWQIVQSSSVAFTLWTALDAGGENEVYGVAAGKAQELSLNPGGDPTLYQTVVAALDADDITTLIPLFQAQGQTLDASATVQAASQGIVWQITDGTSSYTAWSGYDLDDMTQQIFVQPSLTAVAQAFFEAGLTLLPQATVTATGTGTSGSWVIDNDSLDPQNFLIGYVGFMVIPGTAGLDVYGTAIHIARLAGQGYLEIDTEACLVTQLSLGNLSGDTICPNGYTLAVNQAQGGTWNDWMRAPVPPRPPSCVPNGISYCNPP